jgi:nitrite reductase (NADH) large subunit
MGSSAVMPDIPGSTLPGCFVLRDAPAAMAIRTWRQQWNCRSAIVLGGGVLGIEAADALRHLNLQVTILQRGARLMDRQLDERGSTILARYLDGLGISVRTGAAISAIEGDDRARAVILADGEKLPADIVVACAGIAPNVDLAREAGLAVGRGVKVDHSMRTSDPAIYAVGDVAELPGAVAGLWAVGTTQATVAAASVFGQSAEYVPPSTLVSLKMDGIDVKGFGEVQPRSEAQEIIQHADEAGNEHRMLIVENGRIAGAVFVGPPGVGKHVASLIGQNPDLTPVLGDLRQGRWDALETLLDGGAS